MNTMIISVHPDDETLGCGGTILKHRAKGDTLSWVILTHASLLRDNKFAAERKNQIARVAKIYGFKKVIELNYPAAALHTVDFAKLVARLSEVLQQIRPAVVYMNNRSDIHSDHQIAAKAIFSATKAFRAPFIKKIYMYECLSETEAAPPFLENAFVPNVYSDISRTIEKKISTMKIYRSEIASAPFPRSVEAIRALACFRGASIGVHYAEAFMLVREIA